MHVSFFIFSTACVLCHSCNFITKFNKKDAPGGDLIRVVLIRFPGSIPGDI